MNGRSLSRWLTIAFAAQVGACPNRPTPTPVFDAALTSDATGPRVDAAPTVTSAGAKDQVETRPDRPWIDGSAYAKLQAGGLAVLQPWLAHLIGSRGQPAARLKPQRFGQRLTPAALEQNATLLDEMGRMGIGYEVDNSAGWIRLVQLRFPAGPRMGEALDVALLGQWGAPDARTTNTEGQLELAWWLPSIWGNARRHRARWAAVRGELDGHTEGLTWVLVQTAPDWVGAPRGRLGTAPWLGIGVKAQAVKQALNEPDNAATVDTYAWSGIGVGPTTDQAQWAVTLADGRVIEWEVGLRSSRATEVWHHLRLLYDGTDVLDAADDGTAFTWQLPGQVIEASLEAAIVRVKATAR